MQKKSLVIIRLFCKNHETEKFFGAILCANFVQAVLFLSLFCFSVIPFLLSLINVTHFILWPKYSGDKVACNLLLWFVDCFFIVVSATQILKRNLLLYLCSERREFWESENKWRTRDRECYHTVCACVVLFFGLIRGKL